MEMGKNLNKKIQKSGLVLITVGILATAAGCGSEHVAQNSSPGIEQAATPSPATSTDTIHDPQTLPSVPEAPESTTTSTLPLAPPTSESIPSTTTSTTTPESPTEIKSKKVRNVVAATLPSKKLIALPVSPKVQQIFPTGLFVAVKGANCAAVTEFTQEKSGKKVEVQNIIFARPNVITNAHLLDVGAYSGIIGHEDTDGRAATGRPPFETVPANVSSIQSAILRLTATVCREMPPSTTPPTTSTTTMPQLVP